MNFKSSGGQKTRDFQLSVKAEDVSDDGTFRGYGSVFGVIDSYREIVDPGAFTDSLAEIKASGRSIPVLWQHRSDQPIGGYDVLREDGKGLYVEGTLDIDEDPMAKLAHTKLKRRRVTGLSIGFYVREDSYDRVEKVTHLKRLDLIECSLVTFPANPAAQVEGVKAGHRVREAFARGEMPNMKDFEAFLREVGASKSVACGITGHGLRSMLRGDPEGGQVTEQKAVAEALAALRGFSLPSFGD